MEREKMAVLDLLIATLKEHEKTLDTLIRRLEEAEFECFKRAGDSSVPIIFNPEPQEEDFLEKLEGFLMNVPEDWSFEVPKIEHTAHITVTYVEPKT